MSMEDTTIDCIPDDVLKEIMLRVPTPAALVHAALTLRSWHHIITAQQFLTEYRKHHTSSPFIGLYIHQEFGGLPSFLMAKSFRHGSGSDGKGDEDLVKAAARAFTLGGLEEHPEWRILDCHNGRLLLARGDEAIEVYSPLDRKRITVCLPHDDLLQENFSACLLRGHEDDVASFRVISVQHRRERRIQTVHAVEYDSRTRIWTNHPWKTLQNIQGSLQGEVMHAGGLIFCKCKSSSVLMLDTTSMEFSSLPLPADNNHKNYAIGEMEDGICCLVSVDSVGLWNTIMLRMWKLENLEWKLDKEMIVQQVLGQHGSYPYFRVRAVANGVALLSSCKQHLHFVLDLKTFSVKDKFEFKDQPAYILQMPWPPTFSVAVGNGSTIQEADTLKKRLIIGLSEHATRFQDPEKRKSPTSSPGARKGRSPSPPPKNGSTSTKARSPSPPPKKASPPSSPGARKGRSPSPPPKNGSTSTKARLPSPPPQKASPPSSPGARKGRSPSPPPEKGSPSTKARSPSPLPKKASPPRKESPPPESVLHVEHLSRNVNEARLKEIFGYFGEVVNVELAMDHLVNLPRGYIEFKKKTDAEKALPYMDGGQMDGNDVRLRFALQPRPRASSPIKAPLPPPERDAPQNDNGASIVEKDAQQHPRESSPRRKPASPPRRRSPNRRVESPRCPADPSSRRRPDSPPVRCQADPSPVRRDDTPPRRRPLSPVRRQSPSPPRKPASPPRKQSPNRRVESPRCPPDPSPRSRPDSLPVRHRADPFPIRRDDTPPRWRPQSPVRRRSPSPPRRHRSPMRPSPRRGRGSPSPRIHSSGPLRQQLNGSQYILFTPMKGGFGWSMCSKTPIRPRSPLPRRPPPPCRYSRSPPRHPLHSRSRSISPRSRSRGRGRPLRTHSRSISPCSRRGRGSPLRQGSSDSSYSRSPSPPARKGPRRVSRSHSPPLRRGSSDSSYSRSPSPPPRKGPRRVSRSRSRTRPPRGRSISRTRSRSISPRSRTRGRGPPLRRGSSGSSCSRSPSPPPRKGPRSVSRSRSRTRPPRGRSISSDSRSSSSPSRGRSISSDRPPGGHVLLPGNLKVFEGIDGGLNPHLACEGSNPSQSLSVPLARSRSFNPHTQGIGGEWPGLNPHQVTYGLIPLRSPPIPWQTEQGLRGIKRKSRWEEASVVQGVKRTSRWEEASLVQGIKPTSRWDGASLVQGIKRTSRWDGASLVQGIKPTSRWDGASLVQGIKRKSRWEEASLVQGIKRTSRWDEASLVQGIKRTSRWESVR